MNLTNVFAGRTTVQTIEAPIVYVVDGDCSVRTALEQTVRSTGWQVRTMTSAEEFLAHPRPAVAACLLTELRLPGSSGLELQRALLDRSELPIIFMTCEADVQSTVRAMKAGAFEFLTKPLVQEVLVTTIGHAIEHSRAAMRQLSQVQALQQRFESLTRREREVMRLLMTGRLNKQVGGELGITEITVKAHRGKMMRKMQAGSFAALLNMASMLFRTSPESPSTHWSRGMNTWPS